MAPHSSEGVTQAGRSHTWTMGLRRGETKVYERRVLCIRGDEEIVAVVPTNIEVWPYRPRFGHGRLMRLSTETRAAPRTSRGDTR